MDGIEIAVGPNELRLHMQIGCSEAEVADYQDRLDALYFRRNAEIIDGAEYQDAVAGVMNRLRLKVKGLRDVRKPITSDGDLTLVFGPNAPPLHVQLGCHTEDVESFQKELDQMYQRDGGTTWQRHADELRRQEIVIAMSRKLRAMAEYNSRLDRMWND